MLGGQCAIRASLEAGNLLTIKIRSETVRAKVTAPSFGGGSPGLRPSLGWLGRTPRVSLSRAVSDSGSGVSEAAAGNSAAEENPGGEGGNICLHVSPSPHEGPGPSAWLRETLSSRQCQLWERVSQNGGRIFVAQ